MLLSSNHHTGGTCFGDPDRPYFIRESNVIAGVTSFGLNGNCVGMGGAYWVETVLTIWTGSMAPLAIINPSCARCVPGRPGDPSKSDRLLSC